MDQMAVTAAVVTVCTFLRIRRGVAASHVIPLVVARIQPRAVLRASRGRVATVRRGLGFAWEADLFVERPAVLNRVRKKTLG